MPPPPPAPQRPHPLTGCRVALVLLAAVMVSALSAAPAAAHGIAGDAATVGIPGFVSIGMEHMLLGWDHLLFVGGIVLLAAQPRRAATVVSAFVGGHSLTLITATLAGWQVDATAVDVVIVLSVALVGGWGVVGRPRRWDVFTGVVFGIGLVHGLGLATRFQALGVPADGMLWKLLAFNVGLEVGQLTAVMAAVAVAAVVSTTVRPARHAALSRAVFVALVAIGATAAPLLALEGFRSVGVTS